MELYKTDGLETKEPGPRSWGGRGGRTRVRSAPQEGQRQRVRNDGRHRWNS